MANNLRRIQGTNSMLWLYPYNVYVKDEFNSFSSPVSGDFTDGACFDVGNGTLYVADMIGKVYESTDYGANFTEVMDVTYQVTQLIRMSNGNFLMGVNDGGAALEIYSPSYSHLSTTYPGSDLYISLLEVSGRIFVGTMSGEIFYSDDFGEIWNGPIDMGNTSSITDLIKVTV